MLALVGCAPLPVLILNLPHDKELTAQNADHDDDGERLEVDAALPRRLRYDVPHLDWTLRLFDIIIFQSVEMDVGFEGLLMISFVARRPPSSPTPTCERASYEAVSFPFRPIARRCLPRARTAQVNDPGRTHGTALQLSTHVVMWPTAPAKRLLGRVDLYTTSNVNGFLSIH